MRTRRTLQNFAAIAMTVIVASALGVSAASLNGIATAKLGAWNVPGTTGAPTVATWSSFTAPNNTNLNGAALNGGGTWIAQFGTWRVSSNRAGSSNAGYSNLTTSVGTVNAAVETTTVDLGGNPTAGVVAMSNGTSFVFAQYDKSSGGRTRLFKYVSGVVTQLAQATGVGGPVISSLRLDATTNNLAVSWNGAVVLTYTLTAAEVALFKSAGHTRFGIIANGDPSTNFDNFHVDI